MKLNNIILVFLFAYFVISCKTTNSISDQAKIEEITSKIESQRYTFSAQTAIPMTGRSINLNYSYSLKVTPDSVIAYLPYFGRAYVAPISPDDAGIKFESTDFDYKISDKKKGVWTITIDTKDTRHKYRLMLKVGDTGYTSLSVDENDRQSITFYGKIE